MSTKFTYSAKFGGYVDDALKAVHWIETAGASSIENDPEYAREKIRAAVKALKRADDMLKPQSENAAQ